jgi:hypothetical protein
MSDGLGLGMSLVPLGRMVRIVGGVAGDAGRNTAGQFVKGYARRRLAQDAAYRTGTKIMANGFNICP